MFGVSVGGSLGLLAAEDPALRDRVRVVAGLAPYTSLADVVRIATTGTYVQRGSIRRYRSKPFAALVAARSLTAALPSAHDRSLVLRRLEAVPDDARDPLAVLRGLHEARLHPTTRALVGLLTNRDPARFDALYSALPQPVRRTVALLSPIDGAGHLHTRVLIASAPHDKYFPPDQARALARRAPHVDLTITPTLQHAVPHFSIGDLAGLFRFDGFVVRALQAAG